MSAPTFYLPEFFKQVDATAGPVTTNGGVTGTYVSAKTANYVWLQLQFTQAVGHATVISIKQATAIAGTGVKTGPACTIQSNLATATNDTNVVRTAATSYTLGSGIAKMLVTFGIDPSALDVTNGFDCLGFTVSDSSQATNFVAGVWLLETKYPQSVPPTAVID